MSNEQSNESNLESKIELVHVIALDGESCRMGLINEDVATTLVAVASEDPADWNEMQAYWPRYTTRVVPEFLSSVAFELGDKADLLPFVGDSQTWIVIDLNQKRIATGIEVQPIGRDACFAMHTDEKGGQHDPLSVHLPPWWELAEQVDLATVFETILKPAQQPHQTKRRAPTVDREFLFGSPLVQAIAEHAMKIASAGRLAEAIKVSKPHSRNSPFYDLTIEVHRDWLMTPREELGGGFPRQMLHGGVDWIDSIVWGHRMRFERGGGQIVALPKESSAYKNGAVGLEEMAIYFDLCRELIDAAWYWCQHNLNDVTNPAGDSSNDTDLSTHQQSLSEFSSPRETLIGFLNEVKLDWLTSPFEDGSAPAFILECSRRRIPRGGGVEIVGMDERQATEHIIDCDCPICIMMAEGKMGIGFCGIDGHHLELDNEFAFSKHESRADWEAEQQEWAEQSAHWDRERQEREQQASKAAIDSGLKDKTDEDELDEFASAWSGSVSDEPIPGDTSGNFKLAFLLAEIITEMKQADRRENLPANDLSKDNSAASVLIKQLNTDFANFRNSLRDEAVASAQTLTDTLEQIAVSHPSLTSRVADFQSRVAASVRRPVPSRDSLEDFD